MLTGGLCHRYGLLASHRRFERSGGEDTRCAHVCHSTESAACESIGDFVAQSQHCCFTRAKVTPKLFVWDVKRDLNNPLSEIADDTVAAVVAEWLSAGSNPANCVSAFSFHVFDIVYYVQREMRVDVVGAVVAEWFESCRLGFSFCFSILDINGYVRRSNHADCVSSFRFFHLDIVDYVKSERGVDAITAVVAEWLRR
ncbi:hypothetical protein MRX96_003094 [Rhipicephalus microplus]